MVRILVVGLIAGWLTGRLMHGRGYGLLVDTVLGVVGAVIGNTIFNRLGVVVYGPFGLLAAAVVGAVVLVAVVGVIRGGLSSAA